MTAETKTVHRIRCDHHYCEITWTGGFGHDWAHTWSAAYDAGWSHGYHRGLHYCPAHQAAPGGVAVTVPKGLKATVTVTCGFPGGTAPVKCPLRVELPAGYRRLPDGRYRRLLTGYCPRRHAIVRQDTVRSPADVPPGPAWKRPAHEACGCACNQGGYCGGCSHAGCGRPRYR